jgi:replicative DNA helicase
MTTGASGRRNAPRDDYYDQHSKEPGVTELIITKQRNGPTGT